MKEQIEELIKKWDGLRDTCVLAMKYINEDDEAYSEWKGKIETIDLLIHDLQNLLKQNQ